MKRSAVALAAAGVLTAALTACGGGGSDASSAPKAASTSDFCGAYDYAANPAFAKLGSHDYAGAADAAHQIADKLRKVGTPSDIPREARAGYETLVKVFSSLSAGQLKQGEAAMRKAMKSGPAGASPDAVARKLFHLSADQATSVAAFTQWAGDLC